ncbi:MAG: hypothetical protein GYB64_17375, partial [Chloroflexi bacterium]|nr:hypothetical protein [Chloroflexota bacterium]
AVDIQELDAERIIVITLEPPYQGAPDTRHAFEQARLFRERVGSPVWAVWDFSWVDLNFPLIVQGLSALTDLPSAEEGTIHPIIVGTGKFVELIASAVGQDQYGGHRVTLVTSPEEALAFIRTSQQQMPLSD